MRMAFAAHKETANYLDADHVQIAISIGAFTSLEFSQGRNMYFTAYAFTLTRVLQVNGYLS